MKRYDIYYFKNIEDKVQARELVKLFDSDIEAAIFALKNRNIGEYGIKIDTKEKRNHIMISIN